ncbi:conserved exported hypothetical protein [uncultured delta proteobacterium]|uniref:DUF4440 domain-containing protein n=1 Tax=uncultured delta proteobacterium TaxID=34034 RepID=A0A212JBC5_9DELT|nr:conserved exported hypothetical protein [uncultured delta proteobacterium]
MKRLFLALMLVFILVGAAQAAQSTKSTAADEKAVAKAVEFMRTSILSAKRADLEKIGLPSMTYAHSSGRVETNTQFIDNLVNKGTVFNELAFSDVNILVDGNTAVVRHKFDSKHVAQGKPAEGHFMVLLVFKKVGNNWKVLTRQAYPAPKS